MKEMLQEAYDDGEYLVRQGDPGSTMFVVQSGDVIATHRVTGEAGEGQEVGFLELCMLDSRRLHDPNILLAVWQVPRHDSLVGTKP